MSFRRSRSGSANDRGQVVRFPAPPLPAEPGGRLQSLRRVGPGIVTGAADVDPALVLTATVAGAAFGYSLLWVVLLCVPFLLTVFAVSARIGHETHRGLVDLLRRNYGRRAALACAAVVILINTAMIFADLMAVTDALSIVLVQPRSYFVVAVAFLVWYVLIFHDYRRITRWLLLLSLPLFVYVPAAIFAAPSVREVLHGTFVPAVSHDPAYVAAIVGLFGSLLTPYILVWQTSSRREQAAAGHVPHGAESHTGAAVTTLLSFSIIVAAGSMLRVEGVADLTTRRAAFALTPAAGELGPVVFALGILGAGMVALPVLVASMCYSIAEAMQWRSGLSEHPWDAARFYVLISAVLFLAAAFNFLPINPVKALYWSQILAGALTLPILGFILLLANDRRVMRTVNSRWQNFWIGAAAGGLITAGIVLGVLKLFT